MIAPRRNEDDDEQRFREALERHGAQILQTLDASISLRTASHGTQRSRHLVRGQIVSALIGAMNTFHLHRAVGPAGATKPRSK